MAGSKIAMNKIYRQERHVQDKRTSSKAKREERMRRRKIEAKEPELKKERLSRNQTRTLDQKRKWDDADEDNLYTSADVATMKRRKLEEEQKVVEDEPIDDDDEKDGEDDEKDGEDDEVDSMLGSDDEEEEEEDDDAAQKRIEKMRTKRAERQPSVAHSTTSTNFDMTPAVLSKKFPNLFSDEPPRVPKVLVTTSLNSTLHKEAEILTSLFPNSEYIRRSAHRYGHKYSVREICKFAANRDYTAVLVLNEDQKKPNRLTIVHLPHGPTLTYSVNNWIEGSKLPGHGKAQDAYYPELLLNNFKSSLGLLAAKSFQTLFPPQPDIEMRQVVTLHNQRDYIFLRRHRYIFRDRRETEKSVQAADGKELHGVEGIRVGLQELGPRCTLKLRRVDKGIGRAGSEGEDALSWEWKAKMEKERTRFNL
ncbi:brix domain-containing protein [Diaporthe helianthi]|uniref:Brix domain-containing protein n=1 Tax=Diaporthe helianthi TaxID=158607 RepID=A0A2P5IC59_DIAHE|nr:brix domain-containing protein [Diaporthe helianthi]